MKISEKNIKTWSRIGSRATFGMTALELGKTIEDLMVLTADTSTSAGLDRFKRQFPGKFLDVGIAEQNMIGIAAGLASEGQTVITATFAPFQTMRCCEQIKVNIGYMGQKVCMVGLASGLVLGMLGYTHCCIEDVNIMRSIPGIAVISPADCGETAKAVAAAVQHENSVYIRLTGGANNPIVYEHDFDFTIGKANVLKEGTDIVIIASGTMVYNSLKAAEILIDRDISATVIDMHTIKPLDTAIIEEYGRRSKLVVTVEEHSVIGGLGSAVSHHLSAMGNMPRQLTIALPDQYGQGGEYGYLLEKHGLKPYQIAERIFGQFEDL
jgi:transketolase